VLIVEDDPTFATILLDAAHEAGLKGVVSTAGAGTLAMARKLQPSAITLDLGLADIDGFVLLDLLKHDPDTAHVPIHIVSGVDRSQAVMQMGAFGVTEKPAERKELVRVFGALRQEAEKKPRKRRKTESAAHPRLVPELA
jgi:DNA-binding response OmpR family regulator